MTFSRNKVTVSFEGIGTTLAMHLVDVHKTDTTSFEGIQNAHSFFEILLADQLTIEGTLPKQIYQLTSLKTLSLAECSLNWAFWGRNLVQLTNLVELYLYGNNLRGPIPQSIGSLTALSILTLGKEPLDWYLTSSYG